MKSNGFQLVFEPPSYFSSVNGNHEDGGNHLHRYLCLFKFGHHDFYKFTSFLKIFRALSSQQFSNLPGSQLATAGQDEEAVSGLEPSRKAIPLRG